jgi:imidazolonepropionase-like amidohydrolase
MKASLILLSVVVFSPAMLLAQDNLAPPDQRPVVFIHVSVIDATGRPAQPDMTVVVAGNRITALGKTASVAVPQNARVTNATGKFMIPGLWDMHQHPFLRKNRVLPLLALYGDIINGVTGIRDTGDAGVPDDFGDLPMMQDFQWRQAIQAGLVLGPRLMLSTTFLTGTPPLFPSWPIIRTEAEARQKVQALKKLGVDFIKIHDNLSREAYFAIADEAKKQGLPFAGHVTNTVTVAEASDAGQKSEEHLIGILVGCSNQEAQMAKVVAKKGLAESVHELIDTYSPEKCKALYAKFVKNGTYIAPSLVREMGGLARRDMNDPRLEYASPVLRADFENQAKNFKPAGVANAKLLHETHYRIVREMQVAGVKLLTGTDGRLFGFDVHDELAELVKAGLTPMQALQAATRNPADYFGKLDSLGTVEKGKLADFVVLDANPLDSISNANKISAVIVDGHLLDRPAVDRLQAQMKEAANPRSMRPAPSAQTTVR